MLVVGIDPGANGAIALLDFQTGTVEFLPTPGPLVQSTVLYAQIVGFGARVIGIEEVTPIPGASAGTNHTFGKNVGHVEMLSWLTSIPVDRIRPKDWQKQIGIVVPRGIKGAARKKAIKEQVAAKSRQLYPTAEIFGPKGGLLDGRSDALMIAHVMGLKYGANR